MQVYLLHYIMIASNNNIAQIKGGKKYWWSLYIAGLPKKGECGHITVPFMVLIVHILGGGEGGGG